MRGVHYSACSLSYKKIAQFHQKCSLMRDCSLLRRLLLPEYTVLEFKSRPKFDEGIFESYVHLNLVVLGLNYVFKLLLLFAYLFVGLLVTNSLKRQYPGLLIILAPVFICIAALALFYPMHFHTTVHKATF